MISDFDNYMAALYGSIVKMVDEPAMTEKAFHNTVYSLQQKKTSAGLPSLSGAVAIARDEWKNCLTDKCKNGGYASLSSRQRIMLGITSLVPAERVLVELIYIKQFTLEETCRLLNKPIEVIKEQLNRIKLPLSRPELFD